ncbi:hypothetical protein MPC4_10369 [Methylocella tundrae]|uniref:Uncharacterized protein n=1 Tax=Methylocella tundrae TaxID=227605 RepID=A0A8B6M1S2_METTU|nr:hypothetical protein MPC1_10024 [Methylocella tundrae]VTZ48419.1 hypothetical protein MPC4_10369 [Methylocella tundrae]
MPMIDPVSGPVSGSIRMTQFIYGKQRRFEDCLLDLSRRTPEHLVETRFEFWRRRLQRPSPCRQS